MSTNLFLLAVFGILTSACLLLGWWWSDHERFVRKLRWFHTNQPHVLRNFLLGRIEDLPEPIDED